MPKKSNEQLFEEAEAELYGEAIKQTEQEVFDDALGLSPDENDGDTSLEQMDDDDAPTGDEEPTDEEEGEEPDESEEGEGDDEEGDPKEDRPAGQDDRGQNRDQDRRGIPPGRLREESEARRTAEAERDAERAHVRELDARLRLIEQGNQPKPQQPERPDMFADPEGWAAAPRPATSTRASPTPAKSMARSSTRPTRPSSAQASRATGRRCNRSGILPTPDAPSCAGMIASK